MSSTFLVTGGTGTIGSLVVERLRALGHTVRTVSRHPHVWADGTEHVVCDLDAGDGLAVAMQGIDTVLHLAGGAKADEALTATVAAAAREAHIAYLLLISVIGADTMPIGYFREKLGAERVVAGSGVPFTILRAAQANSLVLSLVRMLSKLPLVPNPSGLRFEPVDPRDIADRLVELAEQPPAGRVPDLAGPEVYTLRELVQSFLTISGKRRGFFPVRIPGPIGRSYRSAENLARESATCGERTWNDYLAERTTRGS